MTLLLAVFTATASATVKASFVQGEQHLSVDRAGTGVEAAVAALMAGPTAAEKKRQIRTCVLPNTPVRSVVSAGGLVTVDLDRRFVAGDAADAVLARLGLKQTVLPPDDDSSLSGRRPAGCWPTRVFRS